jgi:hypothetical protein
MNDSHNCILPKQYVHHFDFLQALGIINTLHKEMDNKHISEHPEWNQSSALFFQLVSSVD